MSKQFIDPIIIIYSQDKRDPTKQTIAIKLIQNLLLSGSGVLSTQVLQEYAYTGLTKLGQRDDVILRNIHLLEHFEVIGQTPVMIKRAVELSNLYRISFWDSCIIANAESAQCSILYSEDLNPGQFYTGIKVLNPFLSPESP